MHHSVFALARFFGFSANVQVGAQRQSSVELRHEGIVFEQCLLRAGGLYERTVRQRVVAQIGQCNAKGGESKGGRHYLFLILPRGAT